MSTTIDLHVNRAKDALREGPLMLADNGARFSIAPHWGRIAEEVVMVLPLDQDEYALVKEATSTFTPPDEEPIRGIYLSRDPRLLLLCLRYLLDLSGVKSFNLREVENDKEKARMLFDELQDTYGHLITARWRDFV